MSKEQIFCLIRFGEREHLERLMHLGELRFSTIREHRDSKENERGDCFEGAFNIEKFEVTDIKAEHPTIGVVHFQPIPNSKVMLSEFNDDPYLVFSSYAINYKLFENSDYCKISSQMLEFGDYAVMIKDPLQFRRAVFSELKNQGFVFEEGVVKYHDIEAHDKNTFSFFDKIQKYEHQNEYRIIVKAQDYNPLFIQIGSIENYCTIVDSKTMVETEWSAKRRN